MGTRGSQSLLVPTSRCALSKQRLRRQGMGDDDALPADHSSEAKRNCYRDLDPNGNETLLLDRAKLYTRLGF
jgi:hypothetical protein